MKRFIMLICLLTVSGVIFASGNIAEITDDAGIKTIGDLNNYISRTVKADGKRRIMVVEAWATWCGPCRYFSLVVQKVAAESEFRNDFIFRTLDADRFRDITLIEAGGVRLNAVPALIIATDRIEKVETGYKDEETLRFFLRGMRRKYLNKQ